MKQKLLTGWMRVVLVLAGVAVFSVLFLPFWRIDLDAPQYPEGLRLLIYTNRISGDVDIINGLNHYIGMKTLHADDFAEFSFLPYLTCAFAALFILSGISGRKGMLRFTFFAFVLFGVVAMADFWRWEYNYGHDLNPDAAIKVPGMAYQPPLIGYKQLLNFGAYSVPDIGGWLFIAAGAAAGFILLYCVKMKRSVQQHARAKVADYAPLAVLVVMAFSFGSCNTEPVPLQAGKDNCYSCKMTVSDLKFGGEIITKKGKIYKFDDMHCLVAYLQSGDMPRDEIKDVYVVDFLAPHALLHAGSAFYFSSDALRSPMNGNIAAFSSKDSMENARTAMNGTVVTWKELYK